MTLKQNRLTSKRKLVASLAFLALSGCATEPEVYDLHGASPPQAPATPDEAQLVKRLFWLKPDTGPIQLCAYVSPDGSEFMTKQDICYAHIPIPSWAKHKR